MYKTEGYWNVEPKIKRLSFPKRDFFALEKRNKHERFEVSM